MGNGKVYMGVDPGATGAMVTTGSWERIFRFSKMTDREIWDGLADLCIQSNHLGWTVVAALERVHMMPGDGRGSGGKFMANYGMLKGFLIAAGAIFETRFIEVTPQSWYRKLGRVDPKGTTKTEKKRRNQELAQHLFPGSKIIRETADAFLLAEYCRRFHE